MFKYLDKKIEVKENDDSMSIYMLVKEIDHTIVIKIK